MLHVSCVNGRSIHIYILRIESLFPAYELRIESSISSALARHWSFAGAPFSVSFPNSFLLRASRSFVLQKKVGDGIRSCALPKECRTFFPKTTVSWQTCLVSCVIQKVLASTKKLNSCKKMFSLFSRTSCGVKWFLLSGSINAGSTCPT